jgi:hypothetical protein
MTQGIPIIVVAKSTVTLTVPQVPISITPSKDAAVTVSVPSKAYEIVVADAEPIVIEVAAQGLRDAAGPTSDYVWPSRPDAALTYDGARVARIDYADDSYKVFTYDGSGRLTSISGRTATGAEMSKTLTYSGGNLVSVTTEGL